jgi:hypothetical protein
MGGLFGGGSSYNPPPPAPPPAPAPAPTIDNARQSRQSQDEAIGRKGRTSSILTGIEGDLSTPPTANKTLLGS